MRSVHEDSRRLEPISLAVLIASFCGFIFISLYFYLTYSGPYRWYVEWALAQDGTYSEELSIAVAILSSLSIFSVFLAIVWTRGGIRYVSLERSGTKVPWQDAKLWLKSSNQFLRRKKYSLVFIVVGICLTMSGIINLSIGISAGKLVKLEIVDLQSKTPSSRWLNIKGQALWDHTVIWGNVARNANYTHYVPLVSKSWNVNEPIRSVLVLTNQNETPDGTLTSLTDFEGMISYRGLPAIVQKNFESLGLKVTDSPLVLELGESPATKIFMGSFFLFLGIPMILISYFLLARKKVIPAK